MILLFFDVLINQAPYNEDVWENGGRNKAIPVTGLEGL
jgi:hypothetical protein